MCEEEELFSIELNSIKLEYIILGEFSPLDSIFKILLRFISSCSNSSFCFLSFSFLFIVAKSLLTLFISQILKYLYILLINSKFYYYNIFN